MSSLSLPLPAEVLVVHVPRLAILELQCLADLLLRRLHGVVVGAELKLTRKLRYDAIYKMITKVTFLLQGSRLLK